ncbi:anti-sigma factor family protein [Alteromonas lipolytica]|uniref:Uncharacterized protein n=1 Tax=Alteromonas lipolytica TaxID=1856405 RepID=A0A1E8FDP7_9ALTE|nr:hypothetical protein [Alteromonas lipolytica]OFI33886.1 hypothetical protein BFC17_20180 [Alteromonas lipolytica]GGF67514.1 hypothetical protein GCM10011338_19620 [Alteromonas lipolytica]
MDKQYIQTHHIIQRYQHGKLTPAEAIEFEEYLLTHPALAEEFELSAIFKKTLSPALHKPDTPLSSRLRQLIWPAVGVFIGSAATWLMVGYKVPAHTASAISPDIIYIGEMRGASTTTAPPVAAVLEQNSQQQVLVLDVSMASGQLFDVTLQAENGKTLNHWPGLQKNAQGELVITTSLQHAGISAAIISVTQSNKDNLVLSATIITGTN